MSHHLRNPVTRCLRLGLGALIGVSVSILSVGFTATAASADTTDGLIVQNETTIPVYIDDGSSVGSAHCMSDWGENPGIGSDYTLNQGQNNSTSNQALVEWSSSGDCNDVNNWLFPFTLIVGGNQVASAMVGLSSNYFPPWCVYGTPSQYPPGPTQTYGGASYPLGTIGATNMACAGFCTTPACPEVTYSTWLGPNPLVVYGSGFDVLMNAVSPVDKNTPPNACDSVVGATGGSFCLTVQVVPEGATYGAPQSDQSPNSSTSGTPEATPVATQTSTLAGPLPITMPQPRQDIYGSNPKAGKVSESIQNGQLMITSSMTLGSDAKALLTRVGSAGVRNWVTLSAKSGSGTQTLSGKTNHVLAKGALTSKTRNRTETVALSKNATSRLCAAIAGGKTGQLTVTASQFIAEANHTYEMDTAKKVSLKKCPTA
jgi:hypothetical protein